MKYLTLVLLCIMLSGAALLSSCGSDDDGGGNSTPTPNPSTLNEESLNTETRSRAAGESARTTQETNPQTETIAGNPVEFNEGTEANLRSTDSKRKYSVITGGGRKSATQIDGGRGGSSLSEGDEVVWLIETVDGVDVSTDPNNVFAYYFYEDGAYEIYNAATDDWEWGWYYIDENFEYLVFDINDPDFEQIWEINKINAGELEVTNIDDGTTLGAAAWIIGEGEIELTYDAAYIKGIIDGKVWSLREFLENDSVVDIAGVTIDESLRFNSDGKIYIANNISFQDSIVGSFNNFIIDSGSYSVLIDEFALSAIPASSPTEVDTVYIAYIEEDVLVLADEYEGDFYLYVYTPMEQADVEGVISGSSWEGIPSINPNTDETFWSFSSEGDFNASFPNDGGASGTYTIGNGVIKTLDLTYDFGDKDSFEILFINENNFAFNSSNGVEAYKAAQ